MKRWWPLLLLLAVVLVHELLLRVAVREGLAARLLSAGGYTDAAAVALGASLLVVRMALVLLAPALLLAWASWRLVRSRSDR